MSDTIQVEVCDVVVTRRTVEISTKCPKCEADLTKESALLVWEYQDQKRHATLVDLAESEFDWPDLPEGGDATVQLEFRCAACDHSLAKGSETEHDIL